MRLLKDFVPAILVLALTAAAPTMADVVAVVSAKSPVTTLSKNQITDIFLGKSARFPDGRPALPVDQIEGTAVRDEFYASFTGKTAAQLKAYWSKIIFTGRGQPPKAVSNSGAVKRLLAQNPGAIGYIEREALDASVRVVDSP
jgi:ABC-type phosphate transport system substrate-binding protein